VLYAFVLVAGCQVLSAPENGQIVSTTGNKINDTIVIECSENYKVMGSDVRRCQPNGQWSGVSTKCEGT